MKLKREYVTRTAGDTQVISTAFGGIVESNENAAFVADCLSRETTPESIVAALCAGNDEHIGVLAADVERILNQLRGIGALDE